MTSLQPDTIARLWTAARAMFARLCANIGDAASIAAREALSVEDCIAIRLWLEPLEAMVRTILLIEAMRARPTAPRPAARAAPGTPRAPASLPFRFSARRLRPSAPRAGSAAAAARPPAHRTILRPPLQQRLAGRIEALARVIARPHAHARRLAHTLRAAPMLALKLARKPPPPTAFYDYAEIPLASIIAAGEARAFPANTS